MVLDYKSFIIDKLPDSAFYVPNFITEIEEDHIIRSVYGVPKPKWTALSGRRVQDYGGVPHARGMLAEKLPNWLNEYMKRISDLGVFPDSNLPNHVLVNEYLAGQGIMAHEDGPLFYPIIATISCGSHTVLELTESGQNKCERLLLEQRSLLLLHSRLYTDYLHAIQPINEDTLDNSIVNLDKCCNDYKIGDTLNRKTRISITIRNVPKVLKLKLF